MQARGSGHAGKVCGLHDVVGVLELSQAQTVLLIPAASHGAPAAPAVPAISC
jgi:hypothetical protein